MFSVDSLVTDLIFNGGAALERQALENALGGADALARVVDVDAIDPRMEMQMFPSMPFRRRGERRLLVIAGSPDGEDGEEGGEGGGAGGPLRADPNDPIVPVDLRPARDALIAMCEALPIRLGRLFTLGTWGDAVLVARSARDLRAICLLPWALDPTIDVDGRRRANRLSQPEFEAKIMAYEKRLEELDDEAILARIDGARVERRGDLIIVDVLEADGTWDQRKSLVLEEQLAAVDRFSLFPGAPASPATPAPARVAAPAASAEPAAAAPAPVAAPEPAGPPLRTATVGDRVVIVFPAERFDLDVAAALGKRDWSTIMRRSDNLDGRVRDHLHHGQAAWIAPLEFLSEVFIDGKPVTRAMFEQGARDVASGVRGMDVHLPRFGPVTLVDVPGTGRFVTSMTEALDQVASLVRA